MNGDVPLPDLLRAIERGDAKATDELLPIVHAELRAIAQQHLARERPGVTLQATALVHEAWLRLGGSSQWDGARHFFGAAAEAMRRILVDRARARRADKRGGGAQVVTLGPGVAAENVDHDELLDLHDALAAFAAEEPRKAKLVELRYFAGLSLDEAAVALDISPATADRDWAFARAWLHDRLAGRRPRDR